MAISMSGKQDTITQQLTINKQYQVSKTNISENTGTTIESRCNKCEYTRDQ